MPERRLLLGGLDQGALLQPLALQLLQTVLPPLPVLPLALPPREPGRAVVRQRMAEGGQFLGQGLLAATQQLPALAQAFVQLLRATATGEQAFFEQPHLLTILLASALHPLARLGGLRHGLPAEFELLQTPFECRQPFVQRIPDGRQIDWLRAQLRTQLPPLFTLPAQLVPVLFAAPAQRPEFGVEHGQRVPCRLAFAE